MTSFGKMLIICGVVLTVLGLLLVFFHRIPFLGKLPGDIVIRKERFVFYFPLATSVILSVVISVILWIFRSK